MPTPIFETVLSELERRRGAWPEICAQVPGINYWWLNKVAQRRIADPGVTKIQALYDYFLAHPDSRVARRKEQVSCDIGSTDAAERVA